MKKIFFVLISLFFYLTGKISASNQLISLDWSPIGSHWLYRNQFKDTERVAFIRVDCIDTIYTVFGARLAEIKNDGIFKKYVFQYLNKDTLPAGVRDNDTFYIKVLKEVVYDFNPKTKEVTIVYLLNYDNKSILGTYPRKTVPKDKPKWIAYRAQASIREFINFNISGIITDMWNADGCRFKNGYWIGECSFGNIYYRLGSTGYFFPYDTEGVYYSGRLIYYYEPGLGYFHRNDDKPDSLGIFRVSIPESHTKFNQFVQCFPNPTKDNFLLQLEGDMQWNVRTQVTIMDYTGRVLAAPFTVNGSKRGIGGSFTQRGVYMLLAIG